MTGSLRRGPGRARDPGRSLDPVRLQGLYYLVTGIWPVVHLRSFMFITGPKQDTWLVKTFGVLVAAIGATLVAHEPDGGDRSAPRLAVASALALTACEIVYVAGGRIRPIYLADAIVEVGLAAAILRRSGQGRPLTGGSEAEDEAFVRGHLGA